MAAELELKITKVSGERNVGGVWVIGTVDNYKFNALVFAEHALCESFELGQSKISKLWMRDSKTGKEVYNFDRGLDVPAANAETQQVVGFLAEGLADLIHG